MKTKAVRGYKIPAKTASKYKNERVTYKGIVFDSKKEFEYYLILENDEKHGRITDLQRQVKFELQPAFIDLETGAKIRPITYVADFVYKDANGKTHIVDTKGVRTDVYKLKYKMMLYKGMKIEEV